ncbi:hypothetical protein FE257_004839 [Aspergillus nanangensis]|uniref:ML-like domain-containing protein n=1 Tax=Aspergillus nanangensis TaxID=2582783 RepID=A0AAD4CRA5_ASPNN|nr:hypothetical protein FE257_004839 [Aspergillus nanangensis]
MRVFSFQPLALVALGLLPAGVVGVDTLSTKGVSTCLDGSAIKVQKLDISYSRSSRDVIFDVSGTNEKEQNVTASLSVTAYGNEIFTKDFNPCESDNYVQQLCPVPSGTFSAKGSQEIPDEFASQIPSIAFAIPDLDGQAKLQLKSKGDGKEVACIQSELSNGKSMEIPGVSYAAIGVAGAALALSGLSALGTAGQPGAHSTSPGFGEVMGWFHTMATGGMLSVDYPSVYRSFTKNFGFSTGLIPWGQMQQSIDNFRKSTGGNLTENSYEFLRNATLEYTDGSSSNSSSKAKRGFEFFVGGADLIARELSTSFDQDASSGNETSGDDDGIHKFVSGIEAYSNQLTIPQSNTFMTVLLIFAIVIAAIAVGILLFKVILELWALYGNFPEKLKNFRKDYWGLLARTITNLILVLYSIWVLYCIYQLTSGDSWAAKVLAAVTLAIFTAILLFFGWRIFHTARKYKKAEGDAASLFENKETWRKYSLFYDNYKRDYWWLFVPVIIYMFAKGCIIAAGNGHGLVQSAGQLIVEALMLALLLWHRPYVAKSTQWINITIQVVRVLSVACVLVFVEELGLSQTTKTVTGIVLIAVQSALTGILAILIAINAIILCCRENPHVRRRREAKKMGRDIDDLTPLDARESLLMDHAPRKDYAEMSKFNFTGPYAPYRDQYDPRSRMSPTESTDRLVEPGYAVDNRHGRNLSRDSHTRDSRGSPDGRHPTAPGFAY